jgi:hypothetical protein
VILHRQGVLGKLAAVNVPLGTFQLDLSDRANSLAGLLLPDPLTVHTTAMTRFVNLNGLADLVAQTQPVVLRVVGLVLVNSTGNTVMVARVIERLPL